MQDVASGLIALATAAGFLLLFALVNAGNVYRVECPRAGGTTETEWKWDPINIPYIGYERTGCETHTATRLAFDAVGLWSLDDAPAVQAGDRDYSSLYPSTVVNQAVRGCVASGESDAFCQCAVTEFTTRLRPAEWNTVAGVVQGGGQAADLPESARDAVTAVERDCR